MAGASAPYNPWCRCQRLAVLKELTENRILSQNNFLTLFSLMSHFYTPWKRQKIIGDIRLKWVNPFHYNTRFHFSYLNFIQIFENQWMHIYGVHWSISLGSCSRKKVLMLHTQYILRFWLKTTTQNLYNCNFGKLIY